MQAPSVWLAIYHAHCEASSLQGKPAKYHLIRMLKTVERAASPEAKMSLAAFYGWHTQLARLLAAHRDVDLSLAHMRDTRDPPTPPLHQACIRGHERCAAILLAYRADPSSIYRGRTALQHAAEHGNTTFEAESRRQAEQIPAGRLGTAEEFGQACAFLCSPGAGYVTGQNLRIDGGLFPGAF